MNPKLSADFILSALLSVLLLCAPAPAKAGPLDSKTCQELSAQRETMKNLGIENDMAKGPEWAKANLSAGNLSLIKQFIEITERLRFRCAGMDQAAKKGPLEKPTIDDVSAEASSAKTPPLPVKRSMMLVAPKAAPAAANKRPIKHLRQEAKDGG